MLNTLREIREALERITIHCRNSIGLEKPDDSNWLIQAEEANAKLTTLIEQWESAGMSQAHALDIICRHLPDDGLTGANRRWNPVARAIVKDLVAEGLQLRISASEPLPAPPITGEAGEV